MLFFANLYPKAHEKESPIIARPKSLPRRPKSKKDPKKTEKKQKPRLMLGLRKRCRESDL